MKNANAVHMLARGCQKHQNNLKTNEKTRTLAQGCTPLDQVFGKNHKQCSHASICKTMLAAGVLTS